MLFAVVLCIQGQWDAALVINMPDSIEHVATPLHIAAECGHAKLIPVLLEVSSVIYTVYFSMYTHLL
jgi:hypothetical protein